MMLYNILLLLSSNAVTIKRDKSLLYCRVAIVMLIFSFINIFNLNVAFSYKGIGLYGGLFIATKITQIFHMFILAICVVILQLTAFYPRKVWIINFSTIYGAISKVFTPNDIDTINKNAEQFKIIEYPLIILFIITGAISLVSSSDLVSIFLSIELQSYGLYLVSTIYRNSELSTFAGLIYFLLGGLSSCFILFSTSLLYANSGTTNVDGIYLLTSLCDTTQDKSALIDYKPFYINISVLIMSVGFLFKMSSAPFHFWSPDVYDAIPTIVTTFVAIVAKVSILVFLLELVHYTSNPYLPLNFSWKFSLLLSSLLCLVIGTVLGLTQLRIKRLFAYSTISHLGFILLALAVDNIESIQSFFFYLMQYSLSNLNAFIIVNSIGFSLYPNTDNTVSHLKNEKLLDKNYSPIQLISQIKGYFYINSYLSLCLALTLFSFIGIPPLVGFFAKQMVLSSALDGGYVFITLVAILTSVISAVYYLAVIKQIFFEKIQDTLKPELKNLELTGKVEEFYEFYIQDTINFKVNNVILSNYLTITISNLSLLLVLFIFTPQEILSMANILALILFKS
uniref:NADH-ubiquinone oxidoreductase chain 2 n=1 Tax=Heterodermia speciosa TaxID=116794 RepID=A0A3G2Z7D2_9LECA|nr:NADH dehydrogenase subunit 2 [Heterodermia speciosa]AYP35452.1 NADH dehydrogenase subunit 2 [Heterodermia speciosa]